MNSKQGGKESCCDSTGWGGKNVTHNIIRNCEKVVDGTGEF